MAYIERLGAFVGATDVANGKIGLVPQPQAGDEAKYLQGDGTWATPSSGSVEVKNGDIYGCDFVTIDTTQDIVCTAPAAGYDFHDITGFYIDYAPVNANSIIQVGGWINVGCSTSRNAAIRAVAGNSPNGMSELLGIYTEGLGKIVDNWGGGVLNTVPFIFEFNAGSTAEKRYKIQIGSVSSVTLTINKSATDTDAATFFRGSCHLWLREIAVNPLSQTQFGNISRKIDKNAPRSYSLNNTPTPDFYFGTGVVSAPTTATSYNFIYGQLATLVSSQTYSRLLRKNGSAFVTPTSASNRLPLTNAGYGSNNNVIFSFEQLASDESNYYDIVTMANCGLTTGTIYNNTFEGSTSLINISYCANYSWLACHNFNTTETGSPYKQVALSTVAATASGTSGNGAFYDPSVSVTLTPTSASGYLFGVLTLPSGYAYSAGTGFMAMKFDRDGSNALTGAAASSRTPVTSTGYCPSATFMTNFPLTFMMDSTAATATTIKALITHDGSSSLNTYLNRSSTDTDSTTYKRGYAQLAITEIIPNVL